MIVPFAPFVPFLRNFSRLGTGAVLALGAALAGCETPPSGPADAPPNRVRGFAFADWTEAGYGTAAAATALDEIAATGATSISIVITAYQPSPSASAIASDDPRTPLPSAVQLAIQRARALDLSVTLKPHVDLNDGTWRGLIKPADPEAWFEQYESFVLAVAAFGEVNGVEGLVVGTELAGTLEHETRWRRLIERVRSVFSGELMYAASWDEAHFVPFWREMDTVGIDFYFPVARRRDPGRLEILAEWQPWLDRLALLHEQTGRPVLLTEIGYRSVDGAGMHPYSFEEDAALDLGEQADLYWAAVAAISEESWITGLVWWNWLARGKGGTGDTDYTPRGKPAEEVLADAWGGL